MNWFTKILGMSGNPGPGDNFWYSPVGTGNAGADVNHATALQSSVVYACVKIISGAISALPMKVFRRLDGGRQPPAKARLEAVFQPIDLFWVAVSGEDDLTLTFQ